MSSHVTRFISARIPLWSCVLAVVVLTLGGLAVHAATKPSAALYSGVVEDASSVTDLPATQASAPGWQVFANMGKDIQQLVAVVRPDPELRITLMRAYVGVDPRLTAIDYSQGGVVTEPIRIPLWPTNCGLPVQCVNFGFVPHGWRAILLVATRKDHRQHALSIGWYPALALGQSPPGGSMIAGVNERFGP